VSLTGKTFNPDIFGSMIQAVVMDEYRSDLGMHYTSVPNMLKLIKPLFLDELYEEFEKSKGKMKKLQTLIARMSQIKFFDPACGSGNFLIITYKEIRVLEIKILQQMIELKGDFLFVESDIALSQFYGIEIDDFAHEVAILSLWLAEHQMNQYFEEQLAGYTEHKSIIPLKKSGTIVQGNAARVNWKEVCPITLVDEVYIIGNPPYYGSRKQNKEQKDDLKFVFQTNYKSLDYISIWFYKGSKYIEGFNSKCAFVSTNSICQGEQVSITWSRVLSDKIEIDFAHQSFKWTNNAKGNAGVTVVIVGLRNTGKKPKYLFKDKFQKEVKNINPYLIDASDVVVIGRKESLANFPQMTYGNMPLEGGFLRFKNEEKEKFKGLDGIDKFIKKVIGGEEFLKGIDRYCFWIEDKDLDEALGYDVIQKRIKQVEEFRVNGGEVARTLTDKSHQFRYRHISKNESIVVPCTCPAQPLTNNPKKPSTPNV